MIRDLTHRDAAVGTRRRICRWAAGALLVALGCASAPPPAPPQAPPDEAFDGARAFAHLEAIAAFGPRSRDTEGLAAARAYVRGELDALGLEIVSVSDEIEWEDTPDEADSEDLWGDLAPEGAAAPDADLEGASDESAAEIEAAEAPAPIVESTTVESLLAVIPGQRSEVVILAAPIDTPEVDEVAFVGANEGASGAALLLELARVLHEAPLTYTVWLAFVDGDGLFDELPAGSMNLAGRLLGAGELDRVRAAIYYHRVGDADLQIARDPTSDRRLRGAFFDAAVRLGHADAFPRSSAYEETPGGHLGWNQLGVKRVLIVGDPRFGGDEAPGEFHRTAQDDVAHCSPQSLEVVGDVSVSALRALDTRWAKIDRLAEVPSEDLSAVPSVDRPDDAADAESDSADAAETDAADPAAAAEAADDGWGEDPPSAVENDAAMPAAAPEEATAP